MSERNSTIDFGAPTTLGAHVFRVSVPAAQSAPVIIVEDYGYRSSEYIGIKQQERVHLPQPIWRGISDVAQHNFNERLKAKKMAGGHWHTGDTLVERILGKELCVLAWAAQNASEAELAVITRRWVALRPEERWWLFCMTVAEAGAPQDQDRGWRRALYFALSDCGVRQRGTDLPSPCSAGT